MIFRTDCRVYQGMACATAMLSVFAALVGCEAPTPAEGGAGQSVPTVTVVVAEARDIPKIATGTGTTRALEEVTIRARVSGFLQQGPPELFHEGSDVKRGQLLLVIDEEPFRVTLGAAEAKVEEAAARKQAADRSEAVEIAEARLGVSKAALEFAQLQYDRAQGLYRRNAITREEVDEKRTDANRARADVAAKDADRAQANVTVEADRALAKANLDAAIAERDRARLDLGFCRMYAPIDGRIGELQVRLGNYVSGEIEGTPLITIQQLDPMGVDLQISSRYLPEVEKLLKKGLAVGLVVQGDRPYPRLARVFFVNNKVDPSTSTFLVRARVDNPEGVLLPGDYVQTHAVVGTYAGAVVVPEQGVVETQAGPIVYAIVGAPRASRVKAVRVKPIDLYEGFRVLESGLEPGTRVIVEGLQMIRPGDAVEVEVKPLDGYRRPALAEIPTETGRATAR